MAFLCRNASYVLLATEGFLLNLQRKKHFSFSVSHTALLIIYWYYCPRQLAKGHNIIQCLRATQTICFSFEKVTRTLFFYFRSTLVISWHSHSCLIVSSLVVTVTIELYDMLTLRPSKQVRKCDCYHCRNIFILYVMQQKIHFKKISMKFF